MEKCTLSRTVKIHECDANGVLRFDLIFDLFQDLADTHAAAMGLGYEYGISRGIGWVGANYAVKVERMPALNESFTLATWPSDKTLITGIREFSAIDKQGKPLFYASSQWALINLATKRPVKIEGNVPAYDILPERMVETAFANPALPERTDFSAVFPVRWSEIDLNKHVNNTNYPLWASEAVPRDFRAAHTIAEADIAFKKPAVFTDDIVVETEISGLETKHVIKRASDGTVFARVRFLWI